MSIADYVIDGMYRLTNLGVALKTDITKVSVIAAAAGILIVIVRHSRDKAMLFNHGINDHQTVPRCDGDRQIIKGDTKPDAQDRNQTVPCPDCGDTYLYATSYDRCYKCGRNIG